MRSFLQLLVAVLTIGCFFGTIVNVEGQAKRNNALCYTCLNKDCDDLLTSEIKKCEYSVDSTIACMTYLNPSKEVIARGCGDDPVKSCFDIDDAFLKSKKCQENTAPCQNGTTTPMPWDIVKPMPDDMLLCPCVGDLCNIGSGASRHSIRLVMGFVAIFWYFT
ncbi:hypothetical protein Ocin01_10584 [Orchesella cincta]|uniref:Uncharacterized protein n=1 Tax=Orchesella cincta TaxID=48709 RepID=A0A1D2MTS2_ORCCI|nr:hypothetical protein Ocin01_10584 [Orchesella cincta]